MIVFVKAEEKKMILYIMSGGREFDCYHIGIVAETQERAESMLQELLAERGYKANYAMIDVTIGVTESEERVLFSEFFSDE